MRLKLLKSALVLGVMAGSAGARPPNIVYILADDLGWTDLGCQGSEYYETPNIDRLSSQGVRLTRYYNSQNCAPSRAALMSGQYAPRTGIYTVETLERGKAADRAMNVPANQTRLPLEIPILPKALKSGGYATAMFGKWHLGNDNGYHPSRRGFDEAIVTSGRHLVFKTIPETAHAEGQYLADFLTDRAVDFISRHKERPFFLYLTHYAVHTPIEARPDYAEAWKTKPPRGTHWDSTYAAMIQSLDESVGRILAQLDELNLAENTVIIFSSDNGGLGGYATTEPPGGEPGFTDNSPLRGGKGTLYEGGLRVPFILRWPGVVKPGTTSEVPLAHIDVYPTLIEIAGVPCPADHVLDGMSFLPILRRQADSMARTAIYWHFPGYLQSFSHPTGWRTRPVGAIHAGDFKLLEFFETGKIELYNLREDLSEKSDLASRRPEKVKELHAMLALWRKSIGAPMPTFKEDAGRHRAR